MTVKFTLENLKYLPQTRVLLVMRLLYAIIFFLTTSSLLAQETRTKTIAVRDSIQLDSVSINPFRFKVNTLAGMPVDTTLLQRRLREEHPDA